MDSTLFFSLILSILLGAVIGSEREMPRSGTVPGGAVGFWGIRSYALISLFWGMSVWIDSILQTHYWIVLGMILSALFIAISYVYSSFQQRQLGVTSEYAALLTYCIGAVCMMGHLTIAVILTICLTIILASKEYIRKMLLKVSREEFGTTLKFAVIALVILPLLPDTKYSILDILTWLSQDPTLKLGQPILQMKFFNPHSIWFFVVIMSGVEFIAYILSKTLGEKWGIILSGAVGGLISSTATTSAMTEKSQRNDGHRDEYVVGTLIASSIMFIRVIVIAAFYSPLIVSTIIIPASVMFVILAGATFYFYRQSRSQKHLDEGSWHEYESPFRIMPALKFALVILVVKFIAGIGIIYQDEIPKQMFYYVLGAISGLADVDAITQDMASKSADGSLASLIAASTILIAVMSNNIVKGSIAYRLGDRVFGQKVLYSFLASIVGGLIVIIAMNFTLSAAAAFFG